MVVSVAKEFNLKCLVTSTGFNDPITTNDIRAEKLVFASLAFTMRSETQVSWVVSVMDGDDELYNKGYTSYHAALAVFTELLNCKIVTPDICRAMGLED